MTTEEENIKISSKTIVDKIWIQKSPEVVFKALAEGDQLSKWWPDAEAITIPKKGGRVFLKWSNGGALESSFLTFIEHKELSYKFYGGDIIKFTVTPSEQDSIVTVEHSLTNAKIDTIAEVARHWGYLLVALKCWVEKQWDIRRNSKYE